MRNCSGKKLFGSAIVRVSKWPDSSHHIKQIMSTCLKVSNFPREQLTGYAIVKVSNSLSEQLSEYVIDWVSNSGENISGQEIVRVSYCPSEQFSWANDLSK